jgi:hypothetical protein
MQTITELQPSHLTHSRAAFGWQTHKLLKPAALRDLRHGEIQVFKHLALSSVVGPQTYAAM